MARAGRTIPEEAWAEANPPRAYKKTGPAVWGQGQSPAEGGKCSACGRWHVTSTVVMAAISNCTAMYCGSGYYDEQGAFHAPTPCNTCTQ